MAEQFIATQSPQATGGADMVAEAGAHLNKAAAWDNAFGMLKQTAQTAQVLTEEERKRQSTEDMATAQRDVAEEVTRVSQMPAGDQASAWQDHLDRIQNGKSDKSDTYNRTFLNSAMPKYTSASVEHKRQLTENDIRMSTDTSVLESINTGSFGATTETIQQTANRLNVDVARVRDSYYGSFYDYYQDKISGVTDNDTLNGILAEMGDAEKQLNSPQLMGNKSTGESGEFLRGQKNRFSSTLKSTQAAIQKNNKLTIQATENKNDPNPRGRYTVHPSINKDKYPDAVAYKEAIQNYESHSSNIQQADGYDTETSTYFNSLDDGAKKIVKQDITTSIVNNFDDLDGEVLANTLISQKQNANDGIAHIKANLYSQDELKSAESFMKMQRLRSQPNGEEALNVIFQNEGERNKYDALVAIQESGIAGSMYEANKFINQPSVDWKFGSKRVEQSYNKAFEGLPVTIANRGREVYKLLRSKGVDHDTALTAGEKAIEAKTSVGGVDIHGTNVLIEAGPQVQRSVGTHLEAMTKYLGDEVTHSYDMWSDSVVSYNEFGMIVNTVNKNELVELGTSEVAFKRDAEAHKYAEAWEGAMDNFNTVLQTRVLRKPVMDKTGPTYWNTPDKVMNAFMNTYTFGKGVRKDGPEFTGE